MYRQAALLGLSLAIAAPVGAAPVVLGGGIEQFIWQEYDYGGSKLLKESGQRLYMNLDAEKEVSPRWIYGFRGRIYSGSVNYDGQLLNGTPYSTDTDYDGLAILADFTGRFIGTDGEYSNLALRFGLGGEWWRRHILGGAGYSEEYMVATGKLGLAYIPVLGWFGEAGAKYPLLVDEKVKLYDEVSLTPQGAFSLYGSVGYSFNQRWLIKGYYDSYRFKASDPEPLYNGGVLVSDVYQPESRMDSFGINLSLFF